LLRGRAPGRISNQFKRGFQLRTASMCLSRSVCLSHSLYFVVKDIALSEYFSVFESSTLIEVKDIALSESPSKFESFTLIEVKCVVLSHSACLSHSLNFEVKDIALRVCLSQPIHLSLPL
jgi:hypothetical protein